MITNFVTLTGTMRTKASETSLYEHFRFPLRKGWHIMYAKQCTAYSSTRSVKNSRSSQMQINMILNIMLNFYAVWLQNMCYDMTNFASTFNACFFAFLY